MYSSFHDPYNSNMNHYRSLASYLLAICSLAFFVGCGKPDVEVPINGEIHEEPLYPAATQKVVDAFEKDASILCKYFKVADTPFSEEPCMVFTGIKNNHLWFKMIDLETAKLVKEYESTASTSVDITADAGYGESISFKASFFWPLHFYTSKTTEVIEWLVSEALDGGLAGGKSASMLAFKNGNVVTSTKYFSGTLALSEPVVGYESIFYRGYCFDLTGKALYEYPNGASYKIYNVGCYSVFIAQEECLSMEYNGSMLTVQRYNIKNNENVWAFYPLTEHKMANPKTEYSIVHKEGNLWEFKCVATSQSGNIVTLSTTVDIESPGEFTFKEE